MVVIIFCQDTKGYFFSKNIKDKQITLFLQGLSCALGMATFSAMVCGCLHDQLSASSMLGGVILRRKRRRNLQERMLPNTGGFLFFFLLNNRTSSTNGNITKVQLSQQFTLTRLSTTAREVHVGHHGTGRTAWPPRETGYFFTPYSQNGWLWVIAGRAVHHKTCKKLDVFTPFSQIEHCQSELPTNFTKELWTGLIVIANTPWFQIRSAYK